MMGLILAKNEMHTTTDIEFSIWLSTPQGREEMRAIVAKWITTGKLKVQTSLVDESPPAGKTGTRRLVDCGRPTSMTPKVIAAIMELPEPFDRVDIAAATGMAPDNISNALCRWNHIGWVVKEGYGSYHRTEAFGVI
jgi:hypothetical protein